MNWLELHEKSEALAIEAGFAAAHKDTSRARSLYSEAAKLEVEALQVLEPHKVRTKGITGISAVALWYKAGDYGTAEKLACSLLQEECIPEFARHELQIILQTIWTEYAKQSAGIAFVPGQVLVSVRGGAVVTGGAPLDLIVEKVQTLQSMFYRTIEYLKGLPHRISGSAPKEVQEACRPWLFQSAPGSYQFSIAIQEPEQIDFFQADVRTSEIAHYFLKIVSAASTDDARALSAVISDATYQTTLLKLARNLAPTGKVFEEIALRIPGETVEVALTTESRKAISSNIRQGRADAENEQSAELRVAGVLRAVDLTRHYLEVMVGDQLVRIDGLQDEVDDVIGPMVNKSVVVQVVQRANGKHQYQDIELAD